MNVKRIGLIADSSCDLTPEMKQEMDVRIIPLKVLVGGSREYTDDGSIVIADMFADMKQSKVPSRSACPSVEEYREAMSQFDECFVITLSSKLSGSYNAARLAAEELAPKKVHVFDSKSAAAGETALLLELYELIQKGLSFEEILRQGEEYVEKMRTLFVLKDIGNLVRNGRLSKLPGMIASVLSLYPLLGDNGAGEIAVLGKERGFRKALEKLTTMVEELTQLHGIPQKLVLAYNSCTDCALWLQALLLERCPMIHDVVVVPTGALSSMYAGEDGMIVAFRKS